VQTLAVERSIWIAAPPEQVWSAIVEPAKLEQWFAVGCPWEIPALAVGARVKFYNTPGEVLLAEIEALEPPRLWVLRWLPTPAAPGSALVTTFRLEPHAGGTHVTINESGYETVPAEGRGEWMAQASGGYAQSLAALAALLECQEARQP
jgi:uncharacterized protein YndB with AHSA1/START domain